jgi:hypothetical protein
VDVVEALRRGDAQPLEQAEDDERRQALSRRRHVIERAGIDAEAQRLGDDRAGSFEVGAGHRAADPVEIGGDLAADIAAVEIVESGPGEMIEGGGQRRLGADGTRPGRLAVFEERRRKAGYVFEFPELLGGQPCLAPGDAVAVPGVVDGGFEQRRERHPAALGLGGFEREKPTRHRSRHRERGERPALRDEVMPLGAIELLTGLDAGAASRHQRPHSAGTLPHQEKSVAAHMVHVGIDGGDGRRHRHRGLQRVAALSEDGTPRLGGGMVRRGDDAAAVSGGVEIHQVLFDRAAGAGRGADINLPSRL